MIINLLVLQTFVSESHKPVRNMPSPYLTPLKERKMKIYFT